jgi:TolB protein
MKNLNRYLAIAFVFVAMTLAGRVHAQQSLTVSVVGMTKTATPIAVVPFAQQGGAPLPTDIADVIRNDLNRCGKFRPLAVSEIVEQPSQGSDIKFATWRLLKQDYIVVGRINDAGNGMVAVQYELWDVNRQQRLLSGSMPPALMSDLRGVAHQIADAIFQQIVGIPGAFYTRLAYITSVGTGANQMYSLIVADSDGFNPVAVAHSREALLSPKWSPDGTRIAYVSFESGNSAIYVQNISTGARQLISARAKGINSAPAWSPDGSKLALSLSYSGNPEIYVMDLGSRQETRLTRSLAINTEPVWSPDGQSIYFTSDRSGRPQIYRISAGGGTPERVSFEGQQNLNADVSYDGKQIAMVQANGNVYRIAIMDQSLGGQVRLISTGPIDESPSFAPNASMLVYAADGNPDVLYIVSNDGMVRQRLALTSGDVRQPAWGPYRKK